MTQFFLFLLIPGTLPLPCPGATQTFALRTVEGLTTHDVTVQPVTYQRRRAVRVLPSLSAAAELISPKNDEGGGIAVISGAAFHDGSIEVDVAGKPRPGASPDARGFVGVAFRVAEGANRYEAFYIRPTNGRAEQQVRRNHSTQYISMPDYQWSRLRKEAPERYESYVDLVPGEWTHIRIDVRGTTARLFVNGSAQPVLVVPDLKYGDSKGSVALWIGLGTEAYFTSLRISQ